MSQLFKKCCYAVATALLVIVGGFAGFGGPDTVYAQGWLVVLVVLVASAGLIVDIDHHLFPAAAANDEDPDRGVEFVPVPGTSSMRHAGTVPSRVPPIRIPGETPHGRMTAVLNIRTREHRVVWTGNRKFAGTLRAGSKDGWDVYDVDDELLGWAPDIRSGMELLEKSAA